MTDERRSLKLLSTIKSVAEGVEYLLQLDRMETSLENHLKDIKTLRHELETSRLPDLFDNADLTEVSLPDGTRAKKRLDISGSLPKPGKEDDAQGAMEKMARRSRAIAWAFANGWGPLIKTTVTAEWDKGDSAKADKFYESLRGDNSVKLKREEGIHPMTLAKQVRLALEEGKKSLPLDDLGITAITAVKLTKKGKS